MSTSKGKKIQLFRYYIPVILFGMDLFFLRRVVFSGMLPGGDTSLIMMQCEHWYDVTSNGFGLSEMRSFWPLTGWLGGSDIMLGEGLLHAALRSLGMDLFDAYKWTVFVTHLMGVLFLWLLLRNLKTNPIMIIVGEIIVFFSCSFSAFSGHSQFFSYAYVAAVFWGMERCWHFRNEGGKKRFPYELIITFFVGLCFLTAFYVGYFLVIQLAVATVIFILMRIRKYNIKDVRKFITEAVMVIIFQLWWIIPFLKTYLPILKLLGSGKSDAETALFSADFSDIFRTRSLFPLEKLWNEYFPHRLPEGYEAWRHNVEAEVSSGYPFITALLFIAGSVWAVMAIRKEKTSKDEKVKIQAIMALSISVIIVLMLFLKIGETSLWILIRNIIPGGSAIRAAARALGMNLLPVGIVTAVSGTEVINNLKIRNIYKNVAAVTILVFLAAVNYSEIPVQAYFDDLRSQLAEVPNPPKECKVMVYLRKDEKYDYYVQMRSWMIASDKNLYTVNGYSGNLPPGWDLANAPGNEIYLKNLSIYFELFGVTNTESVFVYDEGSHYWSRLELDGIEL